MSRILVVDDLPALRALTASLLRIAGHDVRTAAGGREALFIAARHELDLILLDMEMPDMDGLEVLGRLRELRLGVPVVVFTGMSDAARRRAAADLGASRVVIKGEARSVSDLLDSVATCASA